VRPLVVVENSPPVYADALAEARESGWELRDGWEQARAGEVRVGEIATAGDAAAALLAVVAGAGLVAHVHAERDLVERFCDDLRRFGAVDYRTAATPRRPRLTAEQRELVDLLADGLTLGEAARRVNLSRRTADRRLAEARRTYGVETTPELLVRAARPRDSA
jgi:DNA-binding CsgD family transcriptional regulator